MIFASSSNLKMVMQVIGYKKIIKRMKKDLLFIFIIRLFRIYFLFNLAVYSNTGEEKG